MNTTVLMNTTSDFKLFLAKTMINRMPREKIDCLANQYHCNPTYVVFFLANLPIHVSVRGKWRDTIPELFGWGGNQIFVGIDWLANNLSPTALAEFVAMRLKGEISL